MHLRVVYEKSMLALGLGYTCSHSVVCSPSNPVEFFCMYGVPPFSVCFLFHSFVVCKLEASTDP